MDMKEIILWNLLWVLLLLAVIVPIVVWVLHQDTVNGVQTRALIALQYAEQHDPEGVLCGHYDQLIKDVNEH